MSALPDSISPCANVRRTCNALMQDPPLDGQERGLRSVSINDDAIDTLAGKISKSILSKFQKESDDANISDPNDECNKLDSEIDGCIENLNFASWDEENWHYTASGFHRPHLSKECEQNQKFERVALYIMVMDCINFCFWPVGDEEKGKGDTEEARPCSAQNNLLEYEHLASALKELAARDDLVSNCDDSNVSAMNQEKTSVEMNNNIVCAEDSFLLAPQNLVKLTEKSFLDMMLPLLPATPAGSNDEPKGIYLIPNAEERVRLIIEMAEALLTFHGGSATSFIAKAGRSADKLVHLILQFFPGFRDATVDPFRGRWVAFYKRAQILVADLWAALCTPSTDDVDAGVDIGGNKRSKFGIDVCNFVDINKITTFADYRVPQLLRSLRVLKYSPSLASRVDGGNEIDAFSMDELYIRASTVQAVEILVGKVSHTVSEEVGLEINSVKMDWFLWNIGEKLDQDGILGEHHRVRTIFY